MVVNKKMERNEQANFGFFKNRLKMKKVLAIYNLMLIRMRDKIRNTKGFMCIFAAPQMHYNVDNRSRNTCFKKGVFLSKGTYFSINFEG